jgi:lipopolysaccharide export system protein LptA
MRLLAQKNRQVAHFTGNVVVHRDEMVVKSPRMDALYDKDDQLTRLELRGGADLREGDRRATGQNADYDAKTRLVVLTGDPHLYDGKDVLTGDRIEMALDTKEVRVDRVHGRVHPDKMEAHQ